MIIGRKNAATANWTEGRTSLLIDLWAAGLSCSKIAIEMGGGITRNAVIGKVHRLGLAGRQPIIRFPPGVEPQPRPPRPQRVRKTISTKPPVRPTREKPQGEAWEPVPGVVPVSMLNLEAGQCKWPVGKEAPFLFCGAPSTHNHYCEHHHAWSVGQGTPSERGAIKAAKHQTNLERFVPEREAA